MGKEKLWISIYIFIKLLYDYRFPNMRGVIQGYAMTETTQAVIRGVQEKVECYKPGSIGEVAPGAVVKVRT